MVEINTHEKAVKVHTELTEMIAKRLNVDYVTAGHEAAKALSEEMGFTKNQTVTEVNKIAEKGELPKSQDLFKKLLEKKGLNL